MTGLILSGLIALAISCAIAPLVLAMLRRAQVLDTPTERSSHDAPVPRGGGIAPAVAALLVLMVASSVSGSDRLAIAVTAIAFGVVGLLEDLIGIRVLHRLAVQFVSAAVAVVLLLGDMTGPIVWKGLFAVATVFWLVAFVNAFNFMDGINGISVVQAVGAGAAWLLTGTITDTPVLAAGGVVIAGASLGFAPFNMPTARMFLGDVGSYFIGAWLASVAVLGLEAGVPPEAVLAPLALYAADTGATLLRRVVRGEHWYLPHRGHAYQRLGDAGWSHVQASALVAGCIAACGALGAVSLGASLVGRVVADIAIVAVITAYLLTPALVARIKLPAAVA